MAKNVKVRFFWSQGMRENGKRKAAITGIPLDSAELLYGGLRLRMHHDATAIHHNLVCSWCEHKREVSVRPIGRWDIGEVASRTYRLSHPLVGGANYRCEIPGEVVGGSREARAIAKRRIAEWKDAAREQFIGEFFRPFNLDGQRRVAADDLVNCILCDLSILITSAPPGYDYPEFSWIDFGKVANMLRNARGKPFQYQETQDARTASPDGRYDPARPPRFRGLAEKNPEENP